MTAVSELEKVERSMISSTASGSNGLDNDSIESKSITDSSEAQKQSVIAQTQSHIDLVHDAPIKDGGMAATLALLRGRKELNSNENVVGRTKDHRTSRQSDGVGIVDHGHEIKLEYRDDRGRKLTPKEAYRQLCYNFHGYGPSKAKLEKRKEKEEVAYCFCSPSSLSVY